MKNKIIKEHRRRKKIKIQSVDDQGGSAAVKHKTLSASDCDWLEANRIHNHRLNTNILYINKIQSSCSI